MKENKLKIIVSICSAVIGVITLTESVLLMPYLPKVWGIVNLIIGIAVFVFAFAVALEKDYGAGEYECKKCGQRFKPSFKAYFWAAHTAMSRRLECPHCGKKSFCRRKID